MSHTTPLILVFDSGIGGLSVYDELKSEMPQAKYIYVSDHHHAPYGLLPEETLIERIPKLLLCFQIYQPDIIVIACNTASTMILPKLRELFSVPIVGVVPAIKPAYQLSQSKVIGLLATPATIARKYTDSLIQDFAPDSSVIRFGSLELVYLAESKIKDGTISIELVEKILQPMLSVDKAYEIDVMVLGCTHFPLLIEELSKAWPREIRWLDSASAVTKRVKSLLMSITPPISKNRESTPKNKAFLTHKEALPKSLSDAFRRRGFDDVEHFHLK